MRSPDVILTAVAERFDLSVERSNPAGGGFSGAEVFLVVTTDGREFAFRKTPQHVALPSERLTALHGLLAAVHRSGMVEIPVPHVHGSRPICDSGQGFPLLIGNGVPAHDPWIRFGTDVWQVEPWMPGSSVRSGEISQKQVHFAIDRLHAFHAAAADYVSRGYHSAWFHNSLEPSPAILRRQGISAELLNGRMETLQLQAAADLDPCYRSIAAKVFNVLDVRLQWLHQELTLLVNQSFAIQPVLRDVWRAHVLFADDRVTGLIDLSAAASDHVAVDIARLLRSWFGTDNARILQALAMCESSQRFNKAERRLLRVLDASSVLLSPVTWIKRRTEVDGPGSCSAEMLARFEEVASIAQAFEPLPA